MNKSFKIVFICLIAIGGTLYIMIPNLFKSLEVPLENTLIGESISFTDEIVYLDCSVETCELDSTEIDYLLFCADELEWFPDLRSNEVIKIDRSEEFVVKEIWQQKPAYLDINPATLELAVLEDSQGNRSEHLLELTENKVACINSL